MPWPMDLGVTSAERGRNPLFLLTAAGEQAEIGPPNVCLWTGKELNQNCARACGQSPCNPLRIRLTRRARAQEPTARAALANTVPRTASEENFIQKQKLSGSR